MMTFYKQGPLHLFNRLNAKILESSSQILLRSFISSLFAVVEVTIKDEQLFCDVLCENSALYHDKQVYTEALSQDFYVTVNGHIISVVLMPDL
jgi:hypothetical protein